MEVEVQVEVKVIVDRFVLREYSENNIYILTHAHSDHSFVPKQLQHPIYCSPTTKLLMEAIDGEHEYVSCLQPKKWCKIRGEMFYAFSANHCVGSIGVFHLRSGVVYWPDGRPDAKTVKYLSGYAVSHIVGDEYMSNCPESFPSITESKDILKIFLTAQIAPVWIKIPHFGGLEALPSGFCYQFSRCGSFRADYICEEVFRLLGLHRTKSKKRIFVSRHLPDTCAESCYTPHTCADLQDTNEFIIVKLSTNWWFTNRENQKQEELWQPYKISEKEFRIFLCSHASPRENKLLQSLLAPKTTTIK